MLLWVKHTRGDTMEYNIGTQVFRDWKIIREIGEGSYGKVYELEKANYGVTAKSALKLIRIPKSASEIRDALSEGMDEASVTAYFEGIVEQFVREIAVMSELKSHPNIVACEDYIVESHGDHVIGWDILIRMELLTGLQEYQLSHPLDEKAVRQLAEDICEALVFCQQKNLIHRDIKPGNIFVDSMGRFKLGDFGVARTAEKTMGGLSKQGTENYMAPEVYFGRPYGGSVDVYSLGMVLYRMMNCNRLPFYPLPPQPIRLSDRENALTQRLQGTPVPPPCNASEEFAAIIQKACAADPRQRYHTAAEMLADLRKQPVAVPVAVHTGAVAAAEAEEDEGTFGAFGAAGAVAAAAVQEAEDEGTMGVFGRSPAAAEREVLRDDDGTVNVFAVTAAAGDRTERVRAAQAEEKTEDPTVPAQKKKKKMLWIPAVALAVVVAVLIFLLRGCTDTNGPDSTGSSSSETPMFVLVPDVVGKTMEEAQQMLEKVGLEAELIYEVSDTQPEGIVLEMGVNANTEVEPGSTILLTISSGKAAIEVPDVLGKTKEDAEAALKNAGFEVAVNEDYSATVESGKVMTQSTEGGLTLPEGSTVTITVSKGKKPVTIPNVAGQDREAAVEALEALGLIVDVTEVYNETVAAGKVISQTPAGETTAYEGDTVQLVISAGTETTTVPNVVGSSKATATTKLQNAGFKVTVKEEYSNTVAAGNVIRQSPSANGTAAVGGTVTIVVSKGKQPVAIPNVVGSSKATATTKLQNAGFKVTVQEEYSSTVAAGNVIRQSPSANTTAAAGSTVTIVVSKGKQPVTIPSVVGSSKSAATTKLQNAGFKVTVQEEYSSTVAAGNVIRQSPSANTTAAAGSTVTIVVSKGAATVAVTGVTLNKTSATLLIGGTVQLSATVAPSNATNTNVTWVSGNPAIAEVSSTGLVTAKAPGTTTITVKTASGSKTAACTITVTAPTMNSFSNLTLDVNEGTSYMSITISNAGTAEFTYEVTSSNKSVANPNRAGKQFNVYGVQPGSAVITVTATTGSYTITRTFTVTVNTPQITLSSTSGTITTNQYASISTFRGFRLNMPKVYISGINVEQAVGYGWEFVSGMGKVTWDEDGQKVWYGSTSTSFSASGTAVFRYYVKAQGGKIYYSPNFTVKASVYKTTSGSNNLRKGAGKSYAVYTSVPANKTVYFTEIKVVNETNTLNGVTYSKAVYGKTTYGGYTGWVIIAYTD